MDPSGQCGQVDDERELKLKIPYQLVIHCHQLAPLALGQSHIQAIVKGASCLGGDINGP
jgi:hypothetical protein